MLDDPNFWFNHIHPDDTAAIFSSLAMLFVEDQKIYEYRFRTSDGSYLWMHDTLRLIRDAEGTPLEVIGLMTDITGRKQMEDTLQRQAEEQSADRTAQDGPGPADAVREAGLHRPAGRRGGA
jgi:hypothetical protein